jgi:hypothetical protein
MTAFPHKSKLRFIAHNPTGELVKILTKEIKKGYGKEKSNNR